MIALVLSPRIGTGVLDPLDAHRPSLIDDYALSAVDYSNQPGLRPFEQYDPALMMVSILRCDAGTLTAIEADPNYYVIHSDNRPSGGIPPAAEFGLLRAYLAQEGVKQATITEWIGTGAQGRTREQIAAILRERLRNLPKAG